jgi:amidase
MDVLICPVAPSAGYQHDVFPWWGYSSMFNLTDFPSIVLPLKGFSISQEQDAKSEALPKLENPFNAANANACESTTDLHLSLRKIN